MQRKGASRDVLLLDIALDNYFRLCLERTDKAALSGDDLCEATALVLRNTVIAYSSEDFRQVCSLCACSTASPGLTAGCLLPAACPSVIALKE